MYMATYPRFGLQPRMLSRTIEDGGTVTSCLFPWDSGGAFMAATLRVATVSYVPCAFLNLLVPAIAILYAWTGTFILRMPTEGQEDVAAELG
jgi:Na+:H+ antiporter, NhaC family